MTALPITTHYPGTDTGDASWDLTKVRAIPLEVRREVFAATRFDLTAALKSMESGHPSEWHPLTLRLMAWRFQYVEVSE